MKVISDGIKGAVQASVHLLNQPLIKEGVKNVAGSVTMAFGLMEMYDVYQIMCCREISTELHSNFPRWVQSANKVVIVCAKISLILSAGVSRPGVFIISSIVGSVFSTAQLDRVFGPNTIFAINPWHPRHIISIAAVLLALPSVAQSVYKGGHWVCQKICHYQNESGNRQEANHWLTDAKIRLVVLFNTITSRPTLHIGNQFGRFILGRI